MTRMQAAVQTFCAAAGVRQWEVAQDLGIDPGLFSHYLCHRRVTPRAFLIRLADYLGLAVDDLIGFPDDAFLQMVQEKAEALL